jgi:molecular chaperone GrpE
MVDLEKESVMPPPQEGATDTPQEDALAALRKERDELRAQADDWLDKYRRSGAEFANYRKRQERDREQQELDLRKRILGRFLPIAEDFRRALAHMPSDAAESQWVQGVALIANKINSMLGEFQVQPMETLGKPFDPAYHQALMREPSSQYPAETVMEELEKGYLIGSQVLKAAMVKVSSGPQPVAERTQS